VSSLPLAYLPSPDRGVWTIGPVPIRAYALCIIAGIVVAVLWGEKRFVARGGEPGMVTDVAVFAVPFGLVGGRLYHVLTDWKTYFGPGANPVDALRIWHGGLGIWGAIALGAVGAWIGCRRRGVPLPFFADAVAPGIVTAQAIGRLGNWFNQELYGGPTTMPWGLEIYRRIDPATGITDPLTGVAVDHTPIAIVQPTFLYELLWNLVVAALVVWADRRFRLGHGRAFAVYVAGYTLGRFFIELIRTDPATRVFGDIRINVVVAAVVFAGAVAYLVLVRKPREEPPFTREDGDAAADPAVATGGTAPAAPNPADDTADDDQPADQQADDRPADDAREPVPADASSGGGPDPAPDRTP
jgi:prolipoprotein diacylglyceryl transferase